MKFRKRRLFSLGAIQKASEAPLLQIKILARKRSSGNWLMFNFYSSPDGGHREVKWTFHCRVYFKSDFALHNPSKIDFFEESVLAGISISLTHH